MFEGRISRNGSQRYEDVEYNVAHIAYVAYSKIARSGLNHIDLYQRPSRELRLPGIGNVRLVGNDKEILSILKAITP